MNSKIFIYISIGLLIILIWRIARENTPEFIQKEYTYQEYLKSDRDQYTTFKNFIISRIRDRFNLQATKKLENQYNYQLNMTSNQFEGPQVHIEKFVYNNQEYYQDSVFEHYAKYPQFSQFDIQTLVFDPDDRMLHKPDVRVQVIPPVPYYDRESKLEKFYQYLDGNADAVKPYKTYTKQVFEIGDDSTITIQNINMDLWLTTFSVTVETEGWKGKVKGENGEEVDFESSEREMNNQRLMPFRIVLKIYPNVSPWYVNNGSAFDKKADMAIGAIYCKKIIKISEDDDRIGVTPKEPGIPLPLIKQNYYESIKSPANLLNDSATDKTVWNKPIYAELYFANFGTYKNFLKSKDDKISFEFIMPLLVRGSWDIQIPPQIVPEYKPVKPYRRSLANILLPSWGLKGFGRTLSTILFVFVGLIVAAAFFPSFGSILRGILNIFRK